MLAFQSEIPSGICLESTIYHVSFILDRLFDLTYKKVGFSVKKKVWM